MDLSLLPQDQTSPAELHQYILDPLSTIVKLAILGNKPIGTKLYLTQNIVLLQEPGIFQALCRICLKCNKSNLYYLYNPIDLACRYFLTDEKIRQHPALPSLFRCAQKGLNKLIDTYKSCPIMRIVLFHYVDMIETYLLYHEYKLFKADNMTSLYTDEIVESFVGQWSADQVNIILNLTFYLIQDTYASVNVRSLENLMGTIDDNTRNIIASVPSLSSAFVKRSGCGSTMGMNSGEQFIPSAKTESRIITASSLLTHSTVTEQCSRILPSSPPSPSPPLSEESNMSGTSSIVSTVASAGSGVCMNSSGGKKKK